MRRVISALLVAFAACAVLSAPAEAARVCWPARTLPAVNIPASTIPASKIPATTIPATTIPRICFAGTCTPATTIPATTLPATALPVTHLVAIKIAAQRLPRTCLDVPVAFTLQHTTVRVAGYSAIDPKFSPTLSARYWKAEGAAVSIPDPTAPGFGSANAAGFPKNQYVRPYMRSDGTPVSGYWRNSPSDGLPTCRVISC
jgi:hypothetical protein